jgi:hypothetical protein
MFSPHKLGFFCGVFFSLSSFFLLGWFFYPEKRDVWEGGKVPAIPPGGIVYKVFTPPESPPKEKKGFWGFKISLNEAGKDDLKEIPGLGEVVAERIVTVREGKGGFCNFQEVDQVPGVGRYRLKQLMENFLPPTCHRRNPR